ncbi:MAG: hypothetical protein ABII09_07270 [Planctomycetota bacterium]
MGNKIKSMAFGKRKSRMGLTIVEVMVAMVILIVAILGTSAYQYSAALNARRGNLFTTASRTALLLSEGWNGVFGAKNFDPVEAFGEQLAISNDAGPDVPAGFALLGKYKVELERIGYYATLSYKDVAPGFRALSIIVSWDQFGKGTTTFESANKSYELTVYVDNPA